VGVAGFEAVQAAKNNAISTGQASRILDFN
jgi:hypothetical protein